MPSTTAHPVITMIIGGHSNLYLKAKNRFKRPHGPMPPPPPAPGVEASPILSYVLHLQKIIITREDLRLAKTSAARQADAMMHRAFKKCQIDTSEPTCVFAIGESGLRCNNRSCEVAPILHSFLSNLGSWLFITDAERWTRQVRCHEKLNQTR